MFNYLRNTLILCLVLVFQLTFATSYFVSVNGNDNPTFVASPNEVDMDLQNRVNNGIVDGGADERTVSANPNAASQEMTLKGTWDNQNSSTSGVKYNDVWGYVDCQGNEYAILGSPDHVHFIDVTNPNQLNEVKRFTPGATTIWRDFKTYQTFAYGVADQGNEGLLVFDLTNISNGSVTMVNQITADFTRCHNVYIDEAFGRLYIVGSNDGGSDVIVYDIATDPANPVKIASPSLSQGGYIHDAYVKNNILYGSHGYNGFHIWNFANPSNPSHIASVQTNGYNHSNWVSEDGNYAFVAEEVPSGLPMLTIDISNMMMDDIEIVKEFKDPLLAPAHVNNTPHNPYVRGNYLITSYYEDGVQIHDISDPLNPVLVAHYDTYLNNNYNGTIGNWGVYPYLPSGNIIASDTKNGLFILKADNITLSTIQAPTAPITEIGAEGGNNMCFGSAKELIATQGADSFVWYRNGEEINTTLNNSITISEAGDYYVVGFSGYCSTESSTIEITASAEIDLSITASLGDQFCANEMNTLTATAGYDYVWSNDGTTQTIDVQESGVYTVTVTDDNGCTQVEEIQVNVLDTPIATIEETNLVICSGESTILSATGGDSYLWSNGDTSSSIEVNEAGNYSVTVTLENGCSDVSEITITDGGNLNPIIESTNGQQICEGTSTELIVSEATAYLWEDGTKTQSITVDQEGLYMVTVTNEVGCTSTAQIQVGILDGPNGQISGSSSLCNNSNIELTATGGSYLWNTSETTDKITISEAGTYTVTVTNDNGCTQVIEHIVTNSPNLSPTISANPDVICTGESTVLTATGGTIFEWSTEATTQEITVDAGNYSVTVTDENGCSGSTDINIMEISFDFEISGDLSLCSGTEGQLSASDGAQWNWSNGQSTQTINITESGTYSVTATSSDGCTATQTVTVEQGSIEGVEITSNNGNIICMGQSAISLTANPPAMTYNWSNGATTQSIDVTNPGEYAVTVTNQDGCSGQSTFVIEGSNFSVDIEGDLSICESSMLTATDGETWIWSTGATTQSITITEPGDYTVEATDKGCLSSKTVTVVEGESLSPEIASEEVSCNEVALTVVQDYENYSWSNGATSQQITVTTSGVYTVTVTNASGCTGINEIEVQIEGINAQIDGASKFCRNTSTTLTATGGNSYLWNTEETTSTIEVSNPGIYIVTVTDENGCSGVADFVVEYFPNTEVVITTNDVLLCEGNTVNLSTSGESFIWNTGAETENIDVTESGVYSVIVTDENGCTNENEIEITFNPLPQGTIVSSNGFEICPGTSTTLSIESEQEVGVTWYLSNENLGNTSEIETDNAGTYTAEITMNGCPNETESVELTLFDPIVPVITEEGNTLSSTSATSYQWFFNDIEIGDQSGQTMIPIISGDYYVVTVDENGCKSQSNTIAVVISSLNDIEWISNTKLYPNPTDNNINLFIESTLKQNVNIQIKNILGQTFLQDEIVILASGNNFKFNTSTYPSGMYFLEIESDGHVEVMKFVVER